VLSGSIYPEFIIVANLDLSSSLYLSQKSVSNSILLYVNCSLISDLGDSLLVQAKTVTLL
jgi:hypothetical protein